VDGKQYQVGCLTGQLDKYKTLRKKIDPNGNEIENSVYRYRDEGAQKSYAVAPKCVFARTKEWTDRMLPDMTKMSTEAIRGELFASTPFLYLLTVTYNGDTKRTLRSVRSALNSTIKPQIVEIVSPYEFAGESKNLSAMVDEMRKMWKENAAYKDIRYNVRQMQMQCAYDKMLDIAIKNHRGFFYVLTLEEGVKIQPDFIESIKRQVLDHFLDFHIISLENQYRSALWAGVLYFDQEFSKQHAFVQEGTNLVKRFDQKYTNSFFPEIS
jgi:hypothetical protein